MSWFGVVVFRHHTFLDNKDMKVCEELSCRFLVILSGFHSIKRLIFHSYDWTVSHLHVNGSMFAKSKHLMPICWPVCWKSSTRGRCSVQKGHFGPGFREGGSIKNIKLVSEKYHRVLHMIFSSPVLSFSIKICFSFELRSPSSVPIVLILAASARQIQRG